MMKQDRILASPFALVGVLLCSLCWSDAPPDDSGIIYHKIDTSIMKGAPPAEHLRVNRSNFHLAENRRWFHLHAPELFPTQRIARGKIPVTKLPRRIRADLNGIEVPAKGAGGTVSRLDFLIATKTDAILVLHKGNIVSEQYFGEMKPDARHYLWSMSKSISIGVLATLIADRPELTVDQRIASIVPEFEQTAYRHATIRHLMDMRSGVNYSTDGLELPWGAPKMRSAESDVSRLHRAQGYFDALPGESTYGGVYEFMQTLKLVDPNRSPGGEMVYKDPDPFALAWACEKTTGMRFSDLLSQYVWSRIGAEHDALIQCDPAGAAIPSSGISATLRDIGRWGLMHLQRGSL